MLLTPFSKFSPGGNDTILLHGRKNPEPAKRAAAALALLGGEQAGFTNLAQRSLYMAGGEFCLNAARAFGAFIDLEEGPGRIEKDAPARHYNARISGLDGPIRLDVAGRAPNWRVGAHIALDICETLRLDEEHVLVKMPGITHLLYFLPGAEDGGQSAEQVRGSVAGNEENMASLARDSYRRFAIPEDAAMGFVACRKIAAGNYALVPHVRVPALGTAMIEGCCGSATLALAAALADSTDCLSAAQPKSVLEARIAKPAGQNRGETVISGPVTLLFRGAANLRASI